VTNKEHSGLNIIRKKLKELGAKCATVSLNPLQISHTICWFRSQDSNKPECKPLNLPKAHDMWMCQVLPLHWSACYQMYVTHHSANHTKWTSKVQKRWFV